MWNPGPPTWYFPHRHELAVARILENVVFAPSATG
jgi:hypothetical protein